MKTYGFMIQSKGCVGFFLLLVACIFNLSVFSQERIPSMYMFSNNILNPAAVGTKSFGSVTLVSKSQWVGVEGAPTDVRINFQMPFASKQYGFGGSVFALNIGAKRFYSFDFDFAYITKISERGQGLRMSFGAKWSTNVYRFAFGEIRNLEDISWSKTSDNAVSTNFGIGTYIYSNSYYVSLSYTDVFDVPVVKSTLFTPSLSPITNFGAGGVITFDNGLKFRPDLLVTHYSSDNTINIGGSSSFMLLNNIWIGATYKGGTMDKGGDFGGYVVAYLLPELRVGYAYDYTMGPISAFAKIGTHEFMIIYMFGSVGKAGIKEIN